ncbi:MAG: ABC transporter ATP-binding protein [Mycobacteriaceae bacterium]
MSTPVLSTHGITRHFGRTEALRGIDLEIAAGEILAVMGPSGSGKSTLLHVLAGILAPTSGTVTYYPSSAGTGTTSIGSLSESDRADLRLRDFGFVFQYGQLLPDLSAVDNVSLPLLLQGRTRRTARTAAADWLTHMDLDDQIDTYPGDMSGGQAQRVAVARALVTGPRVLFADEPTGSLDSLAAEQVISTLTGLARDAGTTVVIVTHDARTASYADREVIVRDGRLSGASSPSPTVIAY